MKSTIVLALMFLLMAVSALGQGTLNRYEVEWLTNPNAGKKDTREVNAVLMFEKDGIRIHSRRSKEILCRKVMQLRAVWLRKWTRIKEFFADTFVVFGMCPLG